MARRAWVVRFAALVALGTASCSRGPDPKLLYTSTEAGGEVIVVDPETAMVQARIPVGKRPRGLKVSRDGKTLYVALSGSPRGGPNVDESQLPPGDRSADGIGVIDLKEKKLTRTFPSGQDPESFDLSLDGKTLFISNEETAELSVLDLEDGKITHKVAVGKEPEGVTVRPDGKLVYVTSEQDGVVSVVDTSTYTVVTTIAADKRPRGVTFTKDSATGFITNELGGSVTVFDAQKNVPTATIKIEGTTPLQYRPMNSVLSPDEKLLYVSTGRGGAIAVINVEKRALDHLIEHVGARPWGLAISSDGKLLFTANGSSDDLSVVETATGKVQSSVKTGGLPWGVVTGAH